MATFSENQTRHFYVVNANADVTAGTGYLVIGGERTDLVENILSAKCTPFSKLQRKTKAVVVTMDSDVNSGAPIAGEDYVLRVHYSQFIAQSDETVYHEFASVHAKTGMTAATLLVELAKNLALNTKKQGLVEVLLVDDSDNLIAIDDLDDETIVGICIREIAQTADWVLGVKAVEPVLFTVKASLVVCDGDEVEWATIEDSAANGVLLTNTHLIADMEYFYHGERGDQYRMKGWPQVINTKYRAIVRDVPQDATEYDVVDIHYAYVGANHSVQKSEKTLSIAVKHSEKSAVLTKINSALGTSIA